MMKKKNFVIFETFFVVAFVLFIYGMFKTGPQLTFGYGLGDLLQLLIYSGFFITQIVLSKIGIKKNRGLIYLTIFGLLIIIILLLNLTIWRGGEYPLTKGFFYNPVLSVV